MAEKDKFRINGGNERQNGGPLPYTEKRKHPRYLVQQPIEYHHCGNPATRYGHTINLNESGLEAAGSEQMEAGKQFEVKIHFSSGNRLAAIQAAVRIIWTDNEARDDGFYHFGGMITNISPQDASRLRCFLSQFLP